MKTIQRTVIDALNGRYLNTDTGKINEPYLNDALELVIANTETLYRACRQKPRRKASSIVWEGLMRLADDALKDDAYPAKPMVAASEHLRKWLSDYGRGYDTLAEAVEWVKAEQDEHLVETSKKGSITPGDVL